MFPSFGVLGLAVWLTVSRSDASEVEASIAIGRQSFVYNMADQLSGKSDFSEIAVNMANTMAPVGRLIGRIASIIDTITENSTEYRDIQTIHDTIRAEFRNRYHSMEKKLESHGLKQKYYANTSRMLQELYDGIQIESNLANKTKGHFVKTCKKYDLVQEFKDYKVRLVDRCMICTGQCQNVPQDCQCELKTIMAAMEYDKERILQYAQYYKNLLARMQALSTLCVYSYESDSVAQDLSDEVMRYTTQIISHITNYINHILRQRSDWPHDAPVHVERTIIAFTTEHKLGDSEPIPPSQYKDLARAIRTALDKVTDYKSLYQVVVTSTANLNHIHVDAADASEHVQLVKPNRQLNVLVVRHPADYGRRARIASNHMKGLHSFRNLHKECTTPQVAKTINGGHDEPILSRDRYSTMAMYVSRGNGPNATVQDDIASTDPESHWTLECAMAENSSHLRIKLIFLL